MDAINYFLYFRCIMGSGYYISEDGEQKGPFTLGELMELEIDIHSRILSPEAETWQDACDLPELYEYFEALGVYFPTGDNLATFGWRLLAYVIDYFILAFVMNFELKILAMNGMSIQLKSYADIIKMPVSQMFTLQLITSVTLVIYNTICEASPMKGSIGKKVFKMVVVDVDGMGMTFLNALLRSFGKTVSIFFFYLGFASIFFTEHKQAIHDLLAKSYVVKRD
jgi:uncharacterized RDD family membrane protein YckC